MADAAVTFLLENVVQLVRHQVSLIGGAERELELLKKDLVSLNIFLRDAAKMPNKPEGFRDIESRIRDVVYEAEDTIDSCMTHAAAAKQKKSFRISFSSKHASLAEEVRALREREVINMVATAQQFAATAMANGSEARQEEAPHKAIKVKIKLPCIYSNFNNLN